MADMPVSLSVFIITKDEADRVAQTILSVVGWVDEVIVVDSGSLDATVEVAKRAGARVVHHDFMGYGPQKRFAESLCCNRWLLNIDADEPLTPAAQDEIRALLREGNIGRRDCWKIPIMTIYPHEREPAPWSFCYNQIRLYDREKAGFSASPVHDTVIISESATIGQLKGAIAHHSHRTITFQVEKFNRYADMQVQDLIARGKTLSKWRLITEFPLSFLKAYFIRRYALYGFWGVSISVSYAYSRFLRVAKFHEMELQRRKSD